MKKFTPVYLLQLLVLVMPCAALYAQKKQISYEQAFANKPTNITKPLPQFVKWLDDENYLESRREGDKTITVKVNVKTGAASPYEEKKESAPPKKDFSSLIKDARNVTWSPDEKWVAYTKANDLYMTHAETEKETRLTFDGSETIKNGYASWVYYEEILGRGSRYRAFWWSPDSRRICYMRFDDSPVPQFPIYVLKDQHGYLEKEFYPKAGDKNPEVKLGIVDIETQKTVWADFNEKDDQYFGAPLWTPTGQLWAVWMNRGQDNLKIYRVDLNSGAKAELYDEKQSTWIDLDRANRIHFLPDNSGFIMRSDKSGWEHFYLHDMNGKLISQVTNGNFTVGAIHKTDMKTRTIYFSARKENSARWDLYSATLDGKKLTRHSFGEYSFTGMNLSPNNKYFITTYSNLSTPSTLVLMDMKGKVVREIANARGEEFTAYELPKKELYRVKSADGLFDLPVTITYPTNFDPNKKYPVLVSIYGGPNAGRIMDAWSLNPQEIWWAQEGLIQAVFDNRSSGHFGKKGMNFIHRKMGMYETEDYMQCGRWLKEKPFVDGSRIGITGGSFGGYMTCMALTYGADVFTHGIANASVTDWQFYDTHYTERYMDTPQENPEGYKQTSVMTYADKLKGILRIVHGTSDDNVHMQNSLALIDKLQNLKKHFEFMLYPGERHGIGATNRAKGEHNRTEAYNFYYKYLLQKPMPEIFWKPLPPQQRPF
jgi:dipeptidyl-peptidase-4